MDLEARLARLETIEVARGLVLAYADVVDRSDFDALGDVFAAGAVLEASGDRRLGLDAITAFYRSRLPARAGLGRHFITNTRVVSADVDQAECASYFLYTTATAGESVIGWGTYRDVIGRGPDGTMRIAEKHIRLAFRGPLQDGWAEAFATATASAPT
jgi:ketosteroid isomerase-like protein